MAASSSSSDSMDDSFRARVNKIFGSLSSSSTQPWSLTDDEVEKREWNRHKDQHTDDEAPLSSTFDGHFTKINRKNFRKQLRDEYDGDDDGGEGEGRQGGGDDEWDIRSSIGLDPTLDNEEEEDEYDKLAEGRENAGDRLYMRDITDHGPYLNSHNVLPNSVHDAPKDSRANTLAARIRLKEDEREAKKIESHSDKRMRYVQEPCTEASEDGINLKSVLKRKNNEALKSSKRVRFDPTLKDDYEVVSQGHQDFWKGAASMGTKSSADDTLLAKDKRHVPDYLQNPSKYTRYTFGSSGQIDEESNSRACMDFLEQVKGLKPVMFGQKSQEACTGSEKSVTFIPRKKGSDAAVISGSSKVKPISEDIPEQILKQTDFPVGIAAGAAPHSEVGAMEEDEPEMDVADRSRGFQKPSRHYRSSSRLEDSVS